MGQPLIFTSKFSEESQLTFSTTLGKCSVHVVVLQRTAEKTTRLYFARAVLLCCSLTVLFGGVLHDVVVLVFLNSLSIVEIVS